uniref:Uncharacterized protein n=1 Tax=Panagrolaimus sp. PS1159 TaxID=55785 RepID=A0AC35GAL3_9BILA
MLLNNNFNVISPPLGQTFLFLYYLSSFFFLFFNSSFGITKGIGEVQGDFRKRKPREKFVDSLVLILVLCVLFITIFLDRI